MTRKVNAHSPAVLATSLNDRSGLISDIPPTISRSLELRTPEQHVAVPTVLYLAKCLRQHVTGHELGAQMPNADGAGLLEVVAVVVANVNVARPGVEAPGCGVLKQYYL